MNITYCWTEPSGYLAACMRELAAREEVSVSLLTWQVAAEAPFDSVMPDGCRTTVLSLAERNDYATVRRLVADTRPDVVFFVGWAHRPYVQLAFDPMFQNVRFVMGADTPIRFDWRQRLALFKIGRLLRKVDAVCVPGERGFQLMRYWDIPGRKIAKLLYGIDYEHFRQYAAERSATGQPWPRRFVYVGRYAPIKGIDVLVEGYRRYREKAANPWPLTVCGEGPLKAVLAGVEGIEDRGFTQPQRLGEVLGESGVFVLPSRLDPWGQAIVEAAAAGLPIVCTQSCGASAEVVRDYHSGLVIPPEDPAALAEAFLWMHDHADRLPAMGVAGQHLAEAYSARRWADNQIALARRLCLQSATPSTVSRA